MATPRQQESSESLSEADLEIILSSFRIKSISDMQENVLANVLSKQDVFVCSRTGSGKSLCYQAVPLLWDLRERAELCVLVVAPLLSIMKEQSHFLNGLGFKATYIGKDEGEVQDILKGHFQFVFTSPEAVLSNDTWRRNLATDLRQKVGLLVVDEAHTILQW